MLTTMFGSLALSLGALSIIGTSAQGGITDPQGDLINGFTAGDLDVLTADATYNTLTDTFTLTATVNGSIGTTAAASYVWGVNRGAGTAGFGANGLPNVLFDRVVRLVPGGTSQIAGGGLPAINLDPGAVTFSGNSMTAVFSGSLLPSTGFQPGAYTLNLWPRVTAPSGFAGVSDFAPDATNFAVTVVPAPAGVLVIGGACLAGRRRR